jgi:hypothetical protein
MTATEDKKPQTVPVDDDNDVDDSDEEGAPEIAATDGQFHIAFLIILPSLITRNASCLNDPLPNRTR